MSGTTIQWDITTPSGTSLAGQFPTVWQSMRTSVSSGLDAEHLWPATGGLAGVHRAGSARIYTGTASQVSSADTDGRLMYVPAGAQLWYLSSATTQQISGLPSNGSTGALARWISTSSLSWANATEQNDGVVGNVKQPTIGVSVTNVLLTTSSNTTTLVWASSANKVGFGWSSGCSVVIPSTGTGSYLLTLGLDLTANPSVTFTWVRANIQREGNSVGTLLFSGIDANVKGDAKAVVDLGASASQNYTVKLTMAATSNSTCTFSAYFTAVKVW